jgi:hypothetical protein
MSDTAEHFNSEVEQLEVQEQARQLLRRLMAELNLRTTGISKVLNVESHTVRRMLNGSRQISLDEMVLMANLGGYSLDEYFLGGARHAGRPSTAGGGRSFEENLGRVFGAIAELLDGSEAAPPAQARRVPAVRPPRRRRSPAELRGEAPAPRQASGDPDAPRRGRGRPRKYPLPDERDLPGPQW